MLDRLGNMFLLMAQKIEAWLDREKKENLD
jgi:hypothetical protein